MNKVLLEKLKESNLNLAYELKKLIEYLPVLEEDYPPQVYYFISSLEKEIKESKEFITLLEKEE